MYLCLVVLVVTSCETKSIPERSYIGFIALVEDLGGEEAIDCGYSERGETNTASCIINAFKANQSAFGFFEGAYGGSVYGQAMVSKGSVFNVTYPSPRPGSGAIGPVLDLLFVECIGPTLFSESTSTRVGFSCVREVDGK